MVATVGSIAVDLSANTAKFIDGFKKSATTVERESSRMSKALNGFAATSAGLLKSFAGGFVGGIVGSLGIGTLEGALSKASEALHRFEDIGIKAKASGLNVEFFQALSFAANETDVEQETLNKSMEIFAKNMGLAKEGTGALYSGLIKLNPELLRTLLTTETQEGRLKAVAEAMKGTTDATDRAALAVAVFGKSGADMVRVLEGGAGALNDFRAEAERLGLVFTEDDIKRWGEAADRVDRLAFVWNIKFAKILADSAPVIEGAIGQVANFTDKINQLSGATDAFVNKPGFKTFMDMMFNVSLTEGGIADTFRDWVEGAETAAEAQKRLADETRAAHENLTRLFALQKRGFDVDQGIMEMLSRIKDLEQQWRDAGAAAKAAGDQMADATHSALRAADFAAMNAAEAHRLPNVYQGVNKVGAGGNAVDEDVMDDVEAAIAKETEATYITGRYNRDAIGKLDANSADHFAGLGSSLDSGFDRLIDATNLLPGKYSLAMASALSDSFGFSGLGNKDSWAGRSMTFASTSSGGSPLGGLITAGYTSTAADASSISGDGSGGSPINVSVTVRPILEGQRLSGQSSAEIKQAASAGANVALRQFYGR